MPPRIKLQSPGWIENLPIRPRVEFLSLPIRSLTTRPVQKQWRADAYFQRQKRAHELAKLTRAQLRKLRNVPPQEEDDPVRCVTTPFTKTFDNPLPKQEPSADSISNPSASESSTLLNFRLDKNTLNEQLDRSKFLSDPSGIHDLSSASTEEQKQEWEQVERENAEQHAAGHENALAAIDRIMKLDMGNSQDRMRVNVDRCIEVFGRHNTDKILPGKDGKPQTDKFRAGADVGSSEVQIAIMTAKIRNLANAIESTGHKDHHNKRNLRLLVHKRQKLLKYLRRKERGGPRWQHLIETLGLTEATWRGEIVV